MNAFSAILRSRLYCKQVEGLVSGASSLGFLGRIGLCREQRHYALFETMGVPMVVENTTLALEAAGRSHAIREADITNN